MRDALGDRIAAARIDAARARAELETRNRELLEQMLAAPAEHKWLRISRADVGEPGCGTWHSRPRLGPLGMLMGWWRVKVSSGCPLSGRLAAVERQGLTQAERGGAPRGAVGQLPPGRAERARRDRLPGDRRSSPSSPTAIGVGVVLAGLGGLEVAVQRALRRLPVPHHPAGGGRLRLHCRRSLLLSPNQILAVSLVAGAVTSSIAFFLARRAFQRASRRTRASGSVECAAGAPGLDG